MSASRRSDAKLCRQICYREAVIKIDETYGEKSLSEIEILNDDSGKPYFKDFSISISHTKHSAVAVSSKCDWCVEIHIKNAIENRATKEEVLDAAMMAIIMGGAPQLMYMNVVYKILDKHLD